MQLLFLSAVVAFAAAAWANINIQVKCKTGFSKLEKSMISQLVSALLLGVRLWCLTTASRHPMSMR